MTIISCFERKTVAKWQVLAFYLIQVQKYEKTTLKRYILLSGRATIKLIFCLAQIRGRHFETLFSSLEANAGSTNERYILVIIMLIFKISPWLIKSEIWRLAFEHLQSKFNSFLQMRTSCFFKLKRCCILRVMVYIYISLVSQIHAVFQFWTKYIFSVFLLAAV